ncbi:MAG: hypothetical protein KGL39_51545 [Patescibacteria group bacterium]|nr:hypothetical protein [Patescibacteria group bacterium]
MSWSLVQATATGAGNSSSSLALQFTSNVAAGNLLVALFGWYGASMSATISDDQGNTWTQLGGSFPGLSSEHCGMWATLGGGSVNSGKPTVSFAAGTSYKGACVAEFKAGTGSFTYSADGASTNTGSGTAMSTGNITVVGSGELVLGGFAQANGSRTITPGSGFLNAASNTNGSSNSAAYLDYLLNGVSGSSPYADAATLSATAVWTAIGASIKAAASGGGGGPWPWFSEGFYAGSGRGMNGGMFG